MRATDDVGVAMLLLKLVVVAASLASAALVWTILGRIRREWQLLGTLAYLWNPVVVFELAAEGHNDAIMVAFVLGAIAFALRGRVAVTVVALALGVLTKFVPLILVPAQLVYFWRRKRSRARLVLSLAVGGAVAVALGALLYTPFWAGAETFSGVRDVAERRVAPSLSGALFSGASAVVSEQGAALATSLLLTGAFVVYTLVRSARVRGDVDLVTASARIALVYVLVATALWWPWYVVLPVALLALAPTAAHLITIFAASLCARLVAPFDVLGVNGFLGWNDEVLSMTLVGVVVPLIVFLAAAAAESRASARIA